MPTMSPNQSGMISAEEPTSSVASDGSKNGGHDVLGDNVDDNAFLTTDCARIEADSQVPKQRAMNDSRIPRLGLPHDKERDEGSKVVTQSDANVSVSNANVQREEEVDYDYEDDRSSVVTESSISSHDGELTEGVFHERLRKTAEPLAVDAINCASLELGQANRSDVLCVNSQVGPRPNGSSPSRELALGRPNNGYVMSEVGRPNGKELALNGTSNQLVPQQSLAVPGATPSGLPATAIFNDSSDITLGNKTFITGSLTIKQYIKDSGANAAPPSRWQRLSKKKKLIVIGGSLFLLTALILATIALSIWATNEDDLTSNGSVLRFVPRGQWIAQPPKSVLTKLNLPVKRIIIAHTATENCTTQSSCVFQTRQIQTYHMESLNWDDIGYNFLVGGDGAAYEGRGWENQGAHTKGYNKGSICIAFIGTFNQYQPPLRQLNVAKRLIEEGVRLQKIDKDYKVYGHRQFYATESPGEALFNLIVKWDNWGNDVN